RVDTAEKYLPCPLPLAHRIPPTTLAPGTPRRSRDRHAAWAVLSRLLLDIDGTTVRRRIDESPLGGRDRPTRSDREDSAVGRSDGPDHRCRPCHMGRRRAGAGYMICHQGVAFPPCSIADPTRTPAPPAGVFSFRPRYPSATASRAPTVRAAS